MVRRLDDGRLENGGGLNPAYFEGYVYCTVESIRYLIRIGIYICFFNDAFSYQVLGYNFAVLNLI